MKGIVMKKSVLVFLVLLLVAACSTARNLDFDSFNKTVEAAAQAKERWAMNPVRVSLSYIDSLGVPAADLGYQEEKISLKASEGSTDAIVTIDRSGFLDDSVSGERYVVVLGKQKNGEWLIKSTENSWRCWEGRGHTDYSNEPCL